VAPDEPAHPTRRSLNDIRNLARNTLLQILEPLVGFALDTGLGAQELQLILRESAVRSVAAGQIKEVGRVNFSGIAATTGISRAEISRILTDTASRRRNYNDRRQQTTNRILATWHQDPKFTTPGGKPADLKMYGRGATFESLVRYHGRGIPTRATLDELTRTGAAEVLVSGLVRAKSSVAVDRGVTARAIRAFGDRATELFSTMLQNMRTPEKSRFIANISGSNISPTVLPLFRKELSTKGADFLADIQDILTREKSTAVAEPNRTRGTRVSVTIYYHEAPRKTTLAKVSQKRKNFRRTKN
jgi:Family of unknown function (DUF6502)